jgi:pentatricopeptide repeat protein
MNNSDDQQQEEDLHEIIFKSYRGLHTSLSSTTVYGFLQGSMMGAIGGCSTPSYHPIGTVEAMRQSGQSYFRAVPILGAMGSITFNALWMGSIVVAVQPLAASSATKMIRSSMLRPAMPRSAHRGACQQTVASTTAKKAKLLTLESHPSPSAAITPAWNVWNSHPLYRTMGSLAIQPCWKGPPWNDCPARMMSSSGTSGGLGLDSALLQLLKRNKVNKVQAMLTVIYQEEDAMLQVDTFQSILHCLSSGQHDDAPNMAQEILHWMVRFHQKDRLIGTPSLPIFNYALETCVNSENPKSGECAEQLLGEIGTILKESLGMELNEHLYTTAMRAYAIHGNVEGAQRIFNQMEADFQAGNQGAQPNANSWTTLIDAHAQSGIQEAGKNVQECINLMKQNHYFQTQIAIMKH